MNPLHIRQTKDMMALALKLLFVVLLCIFVKGMSQSCTLSSIQVQQTNTGLKVGYDPVFEVEVKNLCRCTLTNVYLQSRGFASSMLVNPNLFRLEGTGYLVNNGQGIPSLASFKFRYSWDRAFMMSPGSFQAGCQGLIE